MKERYPLRVPEVLSCLWLVFLWSAIPVRAQDSVFLEELTWVEVRDAIRAGRTTIIIPTGGTEQNGPHMVLGKHNVIVKYAAEQIARRVGDALVAPVLAYVPEGNIDPTTGHMWAPGTITLPPEQFANVIEFAARGFKAQGFLDVALIGDSGPNQAPLRAVAEKLNREWMATAARVHHLDAYYDYVQGDFISWLKARGEKEADIGTHAGIPDTSQLLAIDPSGIRPSKLVAGHAGDGTGVVGNPARASAEYGKKGLEFKIEAAVRQLRAHRESSRKQ